MYLPSHFREDRPDVLRQLMEAHPLAALVSTGDAGLVANHLPLLFDPAEGPYGTLTGHLARTNDQWQTFGSAAALAIFQGPHAYISPAWYPTTQETGQAVPTWNYAVVHVWGTVEVFDDASRLRSLLTRLTARHEEPRPDPWSLADAPGGYIDNLLRAIVGIEMRIHRLEGKWKVSQNQPERNREGVVAGLKAELGEQGTAMAELIRGNRTVS